MGVGKLDKNYYGVISLQRDRFTAVCEQLVAMGRGANGIGTLGEKTLHAVVKHYVEPDHSLHEVRIGPFVADIARHDGIFEVQTGNFNKLRKKIEYFTEDTPLTLIYPIAHTKWIIWIDEETGEITKKRKSPKTGSPFEIFFELYKIKQYLSHPNLSLRILMIDIEEYRNLNGWSVDKKRGSSRYDRIPVALNDEVHISSSSDYAKLIPIGMPEQFTSADFQKHSKLSRKSSQLALNVLSYVGAVCKVGKIKNMILYERAQI